jgi:hypothetical protein
LKCGAAAEAAARHVVVTLAGQVAQVVILEKLLKQLLHKHIPFVQGVRLVRIEETAGNEMGVKDIQVI